MSKLTARIQELPVSAQIQDRKRYRKYLYHAAQAATWASGLYFTTRLGLLLNAPQQTWQMWLMLGAEAIFARLSPQNQLLTLAAGPEPRSPRPRLRLQGTTDLPRVDILVPCCGESLDVIMDTVRAACAIDYPASRFRVLLLDDGGSTELKAAIQSLQATYPNVSYHTRGSHPGKVFAKAGNLNYALFSLQEDFDPEYCAIFDADCIPSPDFLRATLPHLLLNSQAALLTTRQYYYNLPTGDPLSQSRIHFYACENADLDAQGVAIDAGSGALFRRTAILDVGGYPTFSFSEDWQLSLILQGHGYQTLQVEEPLQFGLVPSTLQGHIAQRNRWNIGHSQQIKALLPPVNKSIPRKLQWDIAFNGMGMVMALVSHLFGYLAVPALALAPQVIPVSEPWMAHLQLGLAILYLALTWLYASLQVASTGFRVSLFPHLENSWLAGTHLFAMLKFYCVTTKPKGSFVTGSSANSWNRSSTVPRYRKLAGDIFATGGLLSLCLFFATISAVAFSVLRTIMLATKVSSDMSSEYLTGALGSIFWPPLLHLVYLAVTNLWVPVACLFRPPVYPDRNSRLEETKQANRFPKADIREELARQ
ncbi:nucleotide-diphospho-sugar transferase [Aspergillus egyptiacus]|nr:nucleotide-diphospho-sugar transferase [Aspergillus egyptiacus]